MFRIQIASQIISTIALVNALLLSGCFESNKTNERGNTEPSAIDGGTGDTPRYTDVTAEQDTNVVDASGVDASRVVERDATNSEMIADASVADDAISPKAIPDAFVGNSDANPVASPDASVEDETNVYENVEMCLTVHVDVTPVTMTTLTDSQGIFEFPNVVIDSSSEVRSYLLFPRKVGYRFEPWYFEIKPDDFPANGSFSGDIKDNFAATKIETGPHATGQWKLVEYDCPKTIQYCLESGFHQSVCAGSDCPLRKVGTVYTFEDGCLFSSPEINCVEGFQYTRGNLSCGYDPLLDGSMSLSMYTGDYDETSGRWHIIENTCPVVFVGPPSLAPCTTGELFLERVAATAEI